MTRSFRIVSCFIVLSWLASAAAQSVTVSPKRAALTTTTQTQQFTSSDPNVTWSVDNIIGGNTTVGTISANGLYTPPALPGIHTVRATTATVPAAISSASVAVTDLNAVLTYHNDPARDGVNPKEYALMPSTVNTATFGKLFACPVDGAVYGQPLWIKGLTIAGGIHNVFFIVTQHNSAYAFDADAATCVTYWHINLVDTLHGGTASETPAAWNDQGGCGGDIYPEVGITSTPVIDSITKTMYLVSASEKNPTNPGNCIRTTGAFYHRLHALDLATGSEKFNAPVTIAASVPGTGDGATLGMMNFSSQLHHQRPGLVQVGGRIYVAFASHEDVPPYHGWLIGYRASNVQQQVAVFNTTPNGLNGADGGIWQAGGAPAVDSGGDLYFATGNGVFDEIPPSSENDYGDSILRLHTITGTTPNGSNLNVAGWFTPYDQAKLALNDADLGSGAVVLLPDQTGSGPKHLLVQGGKEGLLYVIDRDNMGQYNPTNNLQIWESFHGPAYGVFGTPAFWHNNLYVAAVIDTLKQFPFDPTGEMFQKTAVAQSPNTFKFPGASPSVSSRATTQGIVWAIDSSMYGFGNDNAGVNCSVEPVPAACNGPAVLHAYNATNVSAELWNSSMAANNRDKAGNAVKFVPPTIANGRVFVATQTEVDIYGLLPN